jgi:hypothetical protein
MFTTSQTRTERQFLSYEEYKTLPKDQQNHYKAEILEDMRDYHSNLLENLEASRNDFQMKMAFYDKQARNVVGIFPNEFRKEGGFYFELITREFKPADPNRTVYRIPYNPSFEEEYEMNEKGSYLVPLEELRIADPHAVAISGRSAILETQKKQTASKSVVSYKAPEPMEDAPYSEMTIRDFYAIHTGKPVSTKIWLNELIKSTK